MENEKQLAKFKNLIWVFAPALVVLTLFVSVQIRHVIIKEDNPCCLILCLTALYVILIGSVIVLLYLYNLRLKQLIDCQNLQIENDKKREYDKLQSQLNHEYRMAALESENLHQFIKEISKKKESNETKDDKTEKIVKISLDTALVDLIKQLKIEIDKL